ncbi:glycosyltransferase [Gramella sp. GC03-9]|uniref:Glycosyltransferase n=1 Tax=Christiangramia oceanisediminis TaxID=2920386 RepID=A0A9X2I1T0_9FLAO|nr:glycosyltransferase [Gramella oceanisediminis]MCP9198295.1 glycosyltransferase [Gramella oceanisediminis]
MKILQLIDTLHPGGAERLAVNYANMLASERITSYLISTRQKGIFRELLSKDVEYHFINKKHTLDILALLRLRKFISTHNIEVVQAHGTSWFFPALLKRLGMDFKLVWHDHYGNSEFLDQRDKNLLRFFSQSFDGIICVNRHLKDWAKKELQCSNIVKLKNFIDLGIKSQILAEFSKTEIQLVCLANLREQKDHDTLLDACDRLLGKLSFRLHLIGKTFSSEYSRRIEKEIEKRDYIEFHGAMKEPRKVLERMHIGILSSRSEGLPLAILEYGASGLAVVSTAVGEIPEVLGSHGELVEPANPVALASSIQLMANDYNLRQKNASGFQDKIYSEYSQKAIFTSYLDFIRSL